MVDPVLPLPRVRCLTKEQAAEYLGIGVTLLAELQVPVVKLGRRCVYDLVDLDAWLTEYKRRGRAGNRQAGTSCDQLKDLGGWKSRVMVDRYAKYATEHLAAAASRIKDGRGGEVIYLPTNSLRSKQHKD
jgi:hypothetical protein